MGGQACVFYGAAQVSKDIDFAIYADDSNYERLHKALSELKAERIAVPRFDLTLARTPDMDALRAALDAEVSAEKALDRAYWEPLRQELEQFRREERNA